MRTPPFQMLEHKHCTDSIKSVALNVMASHTNSNPYTIVTGRRPGPYNDDRGSRLGSSRHSRWEPGRNDCGFLSERYVGFIVAVSTPIPPLVLPACGCCSIQLFGPKRTYPRRVRFQLNLPRRARSKANNKGTASLTFNHPLALAFATFFAVRVAKLLQLLERRVQVFGRRQPNTRPEVCSARNQVQRWWIFCTMCQDSEYSCLEVPVLSLRQI